MKMRQTGLRLPPIPRWPAAVAGVCLVILASADALAHAVVYPAEAPPGAYQKYVLRVPTERPVATVRVAITFPDEVRVISFADVPGWTLETAEDAYGHITGATWSGELPANRFEEFPFIAVNPEQETRLVWRVVQSYADGWEAAWDGPEDSDSPASVTVVAEPFDVREALESAAAADHDHPGGAALPLAGGALAAALLALASALRKS